MLRFFENLDNLRQVKFPKGAKYINVTKLEDF